MRESQDHAASKLVMHPDMMMVEDEVWTKSEIGKTAYGIERGHIFSVIEPPVALQSRLVAKNNQANGHCD
jgi:hypothetical protein